MNLRNTEFPVLFVKVVGAVYSIVNAGQTVVEEVASQALAAGGGTRAGDAGEGTCEAGGGI